MHPAVERLRHGLIVSCQASASDVIYGSEAMAAMAAAAAAGGAVGIRANGASDIAAIRGRVNLPILGIFKQDLPGLGIRITPDLAAARVVVEAGADIVAVDATRRNALEGRLPSADLIRQIKRNLNVPVMADIATFEEGVAAGEAGADIVATTLSGYTEYTPHMRTPDFELVSRLAQVLTVPVIAEGRIASVEDALEMFRRGVYAIVIGSMVTRPKWITQQYVESVGRFRQAQGGLMAVADVGGTKMAFAVVDAQGQLHDYAKYPTQAVDGGDAVLKRIGEHFSALIAAHPDVVAVGVSTGGTIGPDGSVVFSTDFMPGWKGQPIRAALAQVLGLPVAVQNDGNCAALGEALYGAGRGHARVLTLTVGTGVGGGLVIDGRLYTGASGSAMSLGHIGIVRDGQICPCGRQGCLESYVSGAALVREFNGRVPESEAVTTGEAVAEAAAQGHDAAAAAVESLADWLGYGLASLVNLLDPSVIVIGGGIAEIGDLFFNRVRAALAEYGGAMTPIKPVLPAALGTRAGLLGAAALARQHLLDQ